MAQSPLAGSGSHTAAPLIPVLLREGRGHLHQHMRVVVNGAKAGIVRFVGPTQFAGGKWVGVELDEPGKRPLAPPSSPHTFGH